MSVLAVDLAAKYSAAVLLDLDGAVLWQDDSWGLTERAFLRQITDRYRIARPQVLVVEDLPHRLSFAALVKQVCRLQGRIVERMDQLGARDQVLFVPPAEWRNTYPELRKKNLGAQAVVDVAAQLGYTPPDMTARAAGEKGGKATARKVGTDYCSAFLIGRWALRNNNDLGTYDGPHTSRYDTALDRTINEAASRG